MVASRSRLLAGAVAAAPALSLAGCASTEGGADSPVTGVKGTSNHGYHGTWLGGAWTASDIPLQQADGGTLRLGRPDTDRPLRLVFFGYTKCPDICQVVMSTMASAVTRLPEKDRARVQGIFVTTDPARDTSAVLRDYVRRFDPSFIGARGTLADIVKVAARFHMAIEKGPKLPSGGYEVTHDAHVVGLTGGRAQVLWSQSTSPADMAADIERLLEEKA